MQTALHITSLVSELRRELVGGTLVGTEFYRKQRAAYFFVKSGKSVRALGFVYHPAGSGCFCVAASKVRIDSPEKPWPIFGLSEGAVTGVRQYGLDRIFELEIATPEGTVRVVCEVIGPNGNVWLLDAEGVIQKTLRKKQFAEGEHYAPAKVPDRLEPSRADPEDILEAARSAEATFLPAFLKRAVLGLNETLAREVVARAGLWETSVSTLDSPAAQLLSTELRALADRFAGTAAGYLYQVRQAVEVYPFKLKGVDAQPDKFKTLSLATLAMTQRRQVQVSQDDEEKKVLQAVKRAVKRLERRVENIRKDVTEASGYERYKRYAELLQVHRDTLKKGMTSVELEDILTENAPMVTIALEAALGPNENIEAYFKKHRKGREGLELLQRRLQISQGELGSLQLILDDLETDFSSARERHAADIAPLLPSEARKSEPTIRLPYRITHLSTGLTVYIGRDGADNDRTTFEFAKPYELWFHAQQCPGSHVVIKYPNKSFEPSRREIEETAALAAWHSKARHNKLVPVIYCQRRYVRKPRKAKPGLVTVEREKSVMVEPRASFE